MTERPSVPALCPGGTVLCIASGPSLTAADVELCHGHVDAAIVINTSFRIAPWASVLYAADHHWFDSYPDYKTFAGLKYSINPKKTPKWIAANPDVQVLRMTGEFGLELSPTGLRSGDNGGFQAINLAVHLGASRILLLGYDMQLGPRGQKHWHKDHPINRNSNYGKWISHFKTLVAPLQELGIQVINCTRRTALTAFPQRPLEDALNLPRLSQEPVMRDTSDDAQVRLGGVPVEDAQRLLSVGAVVSDNLVNGDAIASGRAFKEQASRVESDTAEANPIEHAGSLHQTATPKVAVCLLTCGRVEYTAKTLESFSAQHPDARERFLLLHGDDGSKEPEIAELAAAYGFETVVQHERQQGARSLRTDMVEAVAAHGALWTVLLENDWEWVRPFPWATFEHLTSTRPDVYSLRLYGQYKERGQKCPCSLRNYGVPARSPLPWWKLPGAPEPVEIGRYHWGAPPAVTRTKDLQIIHRLVQGKTDLGDHSEMVASGQIDGYVARVVKNCVYHIGSAQTKPVVTTAALRRPEPLRRVTRRPSIPVPGRKVKVPLYTPAWQETRRWTLPGSSACLDVALQTLGTPISLLDVGCGEGHLVKRAGARGIPCVGVDLSVPSDSADPDLKHADLQTLLDLQQTFGLVLCWEVAEHLPEAAADTLCDSLVNHLAPGGVLLFTAAVPGQGGQGHINCQPPEYWRDKFCARGLHYDAALSSQLGTQWLAVAPKQPWYGKNISAFRADGDGAFLPAPALPRIAITMRTANRAPNPNYVGNTVKRLVRQGIPAGAIHVCATSPDVAWLTRELGDLQVSLHRPDRILSPNENGLAQIRNLDPDAYDYVLLLEDDLEFCKDFLPSVQRWIVKHARADRHLYRLFAFRVHPPSKKPGAYDYSLERCAGSQAVLLRMADAQDFLQWSDANLLTWGGFRGNARIAFDKLLAAWVNARWPGQPGVMSQPFFVNHVGDVSSIHPKAIRNEALFGGTHWAYEGASA